jgi:uncharacterized membrane protein
MKRVWNRFLVNFFNGIVLLLPVAVTIFLVKFLVTKLNEVFLDPTVRFVAPMAGGYRVVAAKTVIFFIAIIVVALIGWGAKILFVNRVFSLGERLLIKVPIMGRIYKASKQIFNAFFGQGKTIFKQVVLVEYPRKGLYTLGFTTGETKGELKDSVGGSGVNVFVPTTPNPTSGFFLIIPKEDVHLLNMSVEDGLKMVISGGSVAPMDIN